MTEPQPIASPTPQPRSRLGWDFALALLLAAVTLTLCLYFLRDPLGQDDRRVFVYAHELLNGARGTAAFSGAHYRIGFILEHAAAQLLFGYDARAYYAIAYLNSICVVLALFFAARVFFPRWPAALIALTFATNPYFLSQSSWPQIDWPSAWRFLVGLSFAVLALRRSELRARTRYLSALAAGFFFWWSFYTKASAAPLLVMVPTLILFVRFDRRSWIAVALIGLTCAAGLALGFTLDYTFMGDPLACLRKVQAAQTYEFSQEVYLDKGLIPLDLTWKDLLLRYPQLYAAQQPGRLFCGAVLVAALIALLSRARPLLLFLAFALAYWAAVSLMVTHTDPLIPVLRTKDRYFAAAFGLLYLLVGGAGYVLYRWLRDQVLRLRFLKGTFTLLAVAGVGLLIGYQLRFQADHPLDYNVTRLDDWAHERVYVDIARCARRGVGGYPVTQVISDSRTTRLIQMFLPPTIGVVDFDPYGDHFAFQSPTDFAPSSLVYIDRGRIANNERKYYDNQAPEFIYTPPSNWLQVFGRDKAILYYALDLEHAHTTPRADGAALLANLNARLQVKEGTITRAATDAAVTFTLDDVTDGRLVFGRQHYARRPPHKLGPEALWITAPAYVHTVAIVRTTDTAVVARARIVRFTDNAERPIEFVPLSVLPQSDGTVRVEHFIHFDPADGDQAFNVMLDVAGTGTVRVEQLKLEDVNFPAPLPRF